MTYRARRWQPEQMRSPNGCTVIAEGSGPKLVCENLPTSDEKQYTARASLDMAAGAPSQNSASGLGDDAS